MLKRFLKSVVLAVLTFLLITSTLLAAWDYLFPITIVDTSNTTRTYYPVMLGFGGQTLVDADKISANGTDTNIQIGSANISYMMSTTNVTAVIPSLPSGGVVTSNLYTGYSPEQSAFAIITGSGGYVTVTDNATLEPGANFTMTAVGYVDTSAGSNKNLVYKQDAFRAWVSGSTNVTASILVFTTSNLTPDAVGDYAIIATANPAVPHWQNVDDPPSVPDDFATRVSTTNASEEKDVYNISTVAWPSGTIIHSVTVFFRGIHDFAGMAITPYIRLGGVETVGTPEDPSAWTTYSQTLARPGGGNWTTADIDSLQVGIGLRSDGVNNMYGTQVYAQINYSVPLVSVTVTGVSSDEHAVTISANTTHLVLVVDGTTNSTALGGASVPNNGNNWLLFQNDVMPYADNITMSINGAQQLWFAPNVMLTGTTVVDRQGGDHNGTITWGSNSGVSITYGEMTSYESFVATANITSGFNIPTSSMPSTWFAAGENASALPFYDSFSSVATQTGKPVQMYYLLAIIGLAFGTFLGIVSFTRSALMAYIAMVIVFGVGASMTIIPAWIVFVLVIVGAGIMFLYKQVAY